MGPGVETAAKTGGEIGISPFAATEPCHAALLFFGRLVQGFDQRLCEGTALWPNVVIYNAAITHSGINQSALHGI